MHDPDHRDTWFDVWSRRRLDPSRGPVVAQLMAADGFDTTFAGLAPGSWMAWVNRWGSRLQVTPGTEVFEVGCGAGAFLYELHQMGCRVGGIDQSAALVDIARQVLPDGEFDVTDAAEFRVTPTADVVVACSVFQYFDSLDYARKVLERMAVKARRAVAILDVPDSARADEALAERISSAGGAEAYAERYSGLDHLHYAREWIEDVMRSCGLTQVRSIDQDLSGYGNARFRFNAWGLRSNRQAAAV